MATCSTSWSNRDETPRQPRNSSASCSRALQALRNWIRQAEADHGERDDPLSTAMIEEDRRLAREVAELRRVNEVLRAASAYFAAKIDPTRPGEGHEFH
nr:hypothetical protein [Rhodococcus wratislaviensis]